MIVNKIEHAKSESRTIFLIDGSAFLYRAYFSLPSMTAPDGRLVRVTYGFCRILKKFIDDFNPHYLAIAWDTPSEVSSFRKKLYPLYKAQRKPPPIELDGQRDDIKRFASIIGLAQFELQDEEADDILYSLAKDFSKEGCHVVIVTPDKDLNQAISKNIVVFDPFKERWTDTSVVLERYGVPVKKLVFYFSLIGDAVDNIPGVKGVGPKTAQLLVNHYSSLRELYRDVEHVQPHEIMQDLIKYKKDAFISYKLFKLYYYNFHRNFLSCSFDASNWAKAKSFFKELNFESLLKDL